MRDISKEMLTFLGSISNSQSTPLSALRLEGRANGLRAVRGGRRADGNVVCGTKMHAVMVGAFNNAAAYAVNVLRGLVKRDLVHNNFPFDNRLQFIIGK